MGWNLLAGLGNQKRSLVFNHQARKRIDDFIRKRSEDVEICAGSGGRFTCFS
jgi:hypothetical protein